MFGRNHYHPPTDLEQVKQSSQWNGQELARLQNRVGKLERVIETLIDHHSASATSDFIRAIRKAENQAVCECDN